MNYALELARSFNLILDQKRTSISLEVMARTALEASGCAWWLLDPDIGARQRVCRLQLLRISRAVNLSKSIASSGADPIEVGGEPELVRKYSRKLCLKEFETHDRKKNRKCETEVLTSYTSRVAALTNAAHFHCSYEIYSGSAHAEVFGIFRIYGPFASTYPERQTVFMLARKPRAVLAASQAMLVALIQPMTRATILFGWDSKTIGRDVDELIVLANDTAVFLDEFCKSLPESAPLS